MLLVSYDPFARKIAKRQKCFAHRDQERRLMRSSPQASGSCSIAANSAFTRILSRRTRVAVALRSGWGECARCSGQDCETLDRTARGSALCSCHHEVGGPSSRSDRSFFLCHSEVSAKCAAEESRTRLTTECCFQHSSARARTAGSIAHGAGWWCDIVRWSYEILQLRVPLTSE